MFSQKHSAHLLLNNSLIISLEEMNMDVIYAGPIAKTLESVGFLMTLSFVMCFIIIVGCLCLKMYERVFPRQNSDKEGMGHTSPNILGHALKSSPKTF